MNQSNVTPIVAVFDEKCDEIVTTNQSASSSFYLTATTLTVSFRISMSLKEIKQKKFIWDCLKNIDRLTARVQMQANPKHHEHDMEKPYNTLFNDGIAMWKKDRRNEHVKMTVRYDDMPLKIQGNNEILDFVIHDDEGNYLLIEGASNVPYFGEPAATCQKHFLKYIS